MLVNSFVLFLFGVGARAAQVTQTWAMSGETGGVAVGAYLNNHMGEGSSLRAIDLKYSNIGPNGASAIGTALATNTSLHTISMARNKIGPARRWPPTPASTPST